MEGLRKLGIEASDKIIFPSSSEELEIITIDSPNSEPKSSKGSLEEILRAAQHIPSPKPSSPTTVPTVPALCVVKLTIDHKLEDDLTYTPTLNISRHDFDQLWKDFNLEKSVIYHISKGARGLHIYPSVPMRPKASASHVQFTVSSYGYCMAWTYSLSTQTTLGVVIFRRGRNRDHHPKNWYRMLELQTSSVRHPLCLFMVLAMETMEYAWGDSLKWHGDIYEVEKLTKLSPWPSHEEQHAEEEITLDKATEAQKKLGMALVKIEDHIKQLNSLGDVVRSLEDAGFWVDLHGDSTTQMKEAGHEIKQRVQQWHFRFQYLKERGKNQLSVLYNIINRYDTASSISIAQSARKDSRSMKTIADMTMWFLPATCMATLFALHTLPAEMDSFWVYLVVTILVTFLMVAIRYSWFSRELLRIKERPVLERGQSNQSLEVAIAQKQESYAQTPEFGLVNIRRSTIEKDGVRVVATESDSAV